MPGHQVGRAPVLTRRRSSNRPSGAGARSADLLRPVPRAAIGVALILPGDGGHSKSIREETPLSPVMVTRPQAVALTGEQVNGAHPYAPQRSALDAFPQVVGGEQDWPPEP